MGLVIIQTKKYKAMTYKFYVRMDDEAFGPYTVKELMGLGLLDDTLLTEESMNGEWLPAKRFDFEDMFRKEEEMERAFNNPLPTNTLESMQPTAFPQNNNNQAIPNNIGKWNWGAFGFSWLWGVFNGVYWPLLLVLVNLIPYVGWIASRAGCVYLGLKGNEQSWNKKRWSSVAEFESSQRKWSVALIWVVGIALVIGVLVGVMIGIANL